MTRWRPYAPAMIFAVASGCWFLFSTYPLMAQARTLAEDIATLETQVEEWRWVQSTALPAQNPAPATSISMTGLSRRIRASRVTLVRLSTAADHVVQFEIRSDYPGLLRFLKRAAIDGWALQSVHRETEGTLRSAFQVRGSRWRD